MGDRPFTAMPDLTPLTVSSMIRFETRVEHPVARTGNTPGLGIGVAESPSGPVMLFSIAHVDGTVNTAIIGHRELPGFLELCIRQSDRMRTLLTPPAEPEGKN